MQLYTLSNISAAKNCAVPKKAIVKKHEIRGGSHDMAVIVFIAKILIATI